jgi:hypothetical protein
MSDVLQTPASTPVIAICSRWQPERPDAANERQAFVHKCTDRSAGARLTGPLLLAWNIRDQPGFTAGLFVGATRTKTAPASG